jgi:hypothetical protein
MLGSSNLNPETSMTLLFDAVWYICIEEICSILQHHEKIQSMLHLCLEVDDLNLNDCFFCI